MKRLLLLTLLVIATASAAWACELCMQMLTLEETVAQADAVMIGRRVTPIDEKERTHEGPEFIEIAVDRVLKGEAPSEPSVTARAWYGMCPYGIVLTDKEPALIFLKREDKHYTSVGNGCGPRYYPLKDGKVVLDSKTSITVDDFIRTYLAKP